MTAGVVNVPVPLAVKVVCAAGVSVQAIVAKVRAGPYTRTCTVPFQVGPALEIVTLSWLFWPMSSTVGAAFVEAASCVFVAVPVTDAATVCALGRTRRWPFFADAPAVGTNTRGSRRGQAAGGWRRA